MFMLRTLTFCNLSCRIGRGSTVGGIQCEARKDVTSMLRTLTLSNLSRRVGRGSTVVGFSAKQGKT